MGLEQALQDGDLLRQVNALIIAHLRDNNLTQAATAVATATMTPLNVEVAQNKLLDLVCKGLAVEREEAARGVSSTTSTVAADASAAGGGGTAAAMMMSVGYGPPIPTPPVNSLDFSGVQDTKGTSKIFPKHDTRHVSEHKNVARCARFSPDGCFMATGSTDTSIKLFEVAKVRQMLMPDASGRDGPLRPVIRTFYDHMQPINDLDFHPRSAVLISGAKDHTIKFFDIARTGTRRAHRVIQDTHNVRSVAFHPSGDFILAGTDHHIAHLYDVHTFQCYLSSTSQERDAGGAINQVRYSSNGSMYVTASKDGGVRIWDGVSAQCTRAIIGAQHTQIRCQAVFNQTEQFVLSIDEPSLEMKIRDILSDLRLLSPSYSEVLLRLKSKALKKRGRPY